jgi:hypothetical protein
MQQMRMRLLMGLALAMVLALAATTGAQAAASRSIVYVQNGNVFIADADGSNPHQVTTDGKVTSGNSLDDQGSDSTAYHNPTEADDGTIWAAMGYALYHYDQNGTLIKEVVPSTGAYPLAEAVSPDDSKVAYNYDTVALDGSYLGGEPTATIQPADGSAGNYPQNDRNWDGSWLNSGTLILETNKTDSAGDAAAGINYQLPPAASTFWFAPTNPDTTAGTYTIDAYDSHQPVVSRAGNFLAVEEKTVAGNTPPDVLQIYQLNGPPPAVPTLKCSLEPVGSPSAPDSFGFDDPQWSDDGGVLAWYDSRGEEFYAPGSDPNCTGSAVLDVNPTPSPDVSQVSYGLAANNPASVPPGPKRSKLSAVSLSLTKSVKKAALLRAGIKTTLACNATCSYAVVLGINNALARKLKLTKSRHGQVAVGYKTGKFGGGRKIVTVKLSARALTAFRHSHLRTLPLLVAVAARGTGTKQIDHTYRLMVKP